MIYTIVNLKVDEPSIIEKLKGGFGNIIPLPKGTDLNKFRHRVRAYDRRGTGRDLDQDSIEATLHRIKFKVRSGFPTEIYKAIKDNIIWGGAAVMGNKGEVFERYDFEKNMVFYPNTWESFNL